MKTFSHLWQYLAEFFLEWEMFWKFFFENRPLYEIMSRNVVEPEATDENIIQRMRFSCRISNATRANAHANTPAIAHAWARARAHTHTHTQKNM